MPNTTCVKSPRIPLLFERLYDNRGAGDRDNCAGKHAFQSRPAEQLPIDIANPHHQAALHDRDEAGRDADAEQLGNAELQAERKHEQDDA